MLECEASLSLSLSLSDTHTHILIIVRLSLSFQQPPCKPLSPTSNNKRYAMDLEYEVFRSAACDEVQDNDDCIYEKMRECSNPVSFASVSEWNLTFVACNASIISIVSNFRDHKSRTLDLRAVRKGFPSFSSKWVYWKTGINIDTIEAAEMGKEEGEEEETYLRKWFTGLEVYGRENAYDVNIFATTSGCSLGVFRFEHWRRVRIRRKLKGSIPSLGDMMRRNKNKKKITTNKKRVEDEEKEEEVDPARFAMIKMQRDMSDRIQNICLHTKQKTRECLKVHADSLLKRARVLRSCTDRIEKHQSEFSQEIETVMRSSDSSLEIVTRLGAASDVCSGVRDDISRSWSRIRNRLRSELLPRARTRGETVESTIKMLYRILLLEQRDQDVSAFIISELVSQSQRKFFFYYYLFFTYTHKC